ncbi:MAG: hypothetical protein EA378_06220 [Phycisphaerales bacterium]|nr:MAG: hypothetical protein EA378_06220 [Phycisphaerales bacterium]
MSQVPGGPQGGGFMQGSFTQGAPGQRPGQGQQQVDLGQVLTQMNTRVHELMMGMTNLRRRVWGNEAKQLLAEAKRKARMPLIFRSPMGEDVLLWDLFGGKLDGFYVEAGAGDGRLGSVSYVFDAVGWDGVLVEARPEAAEAAKANRPNARVEHAALTRAGKDGEGTMHVPEKMPLYSYLTTSKRVSDRLAEAGGPVREVKVPLKSLNTVLGEVDGPIDLLVMDLVGGEIDALAGFDRDKYKPRVMMIDGQHESANGQTVEGYMKGTGYSLLAAFAGSRVYVREGDDEIMRRAETLVI